MAGPCLFIATWPTGKYGHSLRKTCSVDLRMKAKRMARTMTSQFHPQTKKANKLGRLDTKNGSTKSVQLDLLRGDNSQHQYVEV